MSTFKPDIGIPVLTEVIDAPAISVETHAPVFSPNKPAVGMETVPVAGSAQGLRAEQWERLEDEVRERVLQQILGRIDVILEQRVRDSLADVLQTAVEQVAAGLRSGLHQTVREVVTHAVRQEIDATSRSSKK